MWITSEREKIPGRVVANAGTPRSYVVETSRGEIKRNRKHLNVDPSQADQSSTSYQQEEVARNSPKVIMTRSRTGTNVRPPERL